MVADYSEVRSLERWKGDVFEHESLAAFKSAPIPTGIHTIFGEGPPIDLHVRLRPGRPMVVFFNGTAPRDKIIHLPVFSGLSILPGAVEASRVCISDPSLYLASDFNGGWYAGSKYQNLQALMPQILAHLTGQAKPSKVMFAGGSSGGFASMYYGTYFPESLAFVWNPQTDVLRYHPPRIIHYANLAFAPAADANEARTILAANVDLRLAHRYQEARNHVLYLQNLSDGHTRHHLTPFLKEIGLPVPEGAGQTRPRPEMHVVVGEWGEGHVPPSKEALAMIFDWLIKAPGSWSDLFAGDAVETKMREILWPG